MCVNDCLTSASNRTHSAVDKTAVLVSLRMHVHVLRDAGSRVRLRLADTRTVDRERRMTLPVMALVRLEYAVMARAAGLRKAPPE